jgi:hypothetical protein
MLSRSLHRSVFGCVCRLAQWPALRGVLGTRSVLIVIRGGAQVVWCSATCVCVCVGTTGPVGASAVDCVCKACDVAVIPPSPGGSPPHDYRRQRRKGPWRSR